MDEWEKNCRDELAARSGPWATVPRAHLAAALTALEEARARAAMAEVSRDEALDRIDVLNQRHEEDEAYRQDADARVAAAVEAEREACAVEAERTLVEFSKIDMLDTTPERLRIARRIRARTATPAPGVAAAERVVVEAPDRISNGLCKRCGERPGTCGDSEVCCECMSELYGEEVRDRRAMASLGQAAVDDVVALHALGIGDPPHAEVTECSRLFFALRVADEATIDLEEAIERIVAARKVPA